MLQSWHNSNIFLGMDLFSEIEDLNSLFCGEKNNEINCGNGFEDFQNKYTILHENYSKEVDNTKKVGKSLAKCLKFYSKLCKKYEVQQKLISNLEMTIQEKNCIIEESQKNIEKMKGLIRMYEDERVSFKGPACDELKRDKEQLLDICCRLMGEIERSNYTTRNLGKLLLRKFRKDLNDEKINTIKQKIVKNEDNYIDVKPPDLLDFSQNKMELKFEQKYSKELKKDVEDEPAKESENVSLEFSFIEEQEKVPEKSENGSKLVEEDKRLEGGCALCVNELPSLPMLEDSVNVLQRVHDTTISNTPTIPVVTPPVDNIVMQPVGCDQTSITNKFYESVSNDCFSSETASIDAEVSFGASGEERLLPSEKDSFLSEEDLSLEEEVNRITAEMTLPRLLSPIPLIDEKVVPPVVPEISKGCEFSVGKKRALNEKDTAIKKLKPCGPLDSIMSAMSLQNEVFKSNGCPTNETFRFTRSFTRRNGMRKSNENKESWKEDSCAQAIAQQEEKLVRKGLSDFVTLPITSKEEAGKNVKQCIGILRNKSEELISKSIVAIVLENIDEPVEIFERPAPPLTKTQNRLIVLLSVFQTLDTNAEKIPTLILSMISKKLFPDNFFWPDDSIESATRFYAALCRSKNDTKTLWKFCIQAMTTMRQRCPVAVFALLQTWPDVLLDSTFKNNILALTVVNLFLHMPKSERLRNLNQKRKLMALKHLLMNFYQFKVEDTIENFAKKVAESVIRGDSGAEKSLVMLGKCRDADWAVKNIVPILTGAVIEWGQGKSDDGAARRILSVINQISSALSEGKDWNGTKVKEMVASLCGILNLGSKSHESELEVVQILLQLKQHEEARKTVSEWIPKKPIDKGLQNEIINISAENVLKEWKKNGKKELKRSPIKQKHKKKWKGKKKKGKKRKNTSANSSGV